METRTRQNATPTQYGKRPPGWIGFHKNGMRFEFQVCSVYGEIRIYILAHPSYGSLRTDSHSAHRHYDSQRRLYYVCVSPANPLQSFQDAKETARAWSYYTEHYIRTGERLAA